MYHFKLFSIGYCWQGSVHLLREKIIKCKKDHVWWCFLIRFAKLEGNFNNRGRIQIRFLNMDTDPATQMNTAPLQFRIETLKWDHAYCILSWLARGESYREIFFINMRTVALLTTCVRPPFFIVASGALRAIPKQETGREDMQAVKRMKICCDGCLKPFFVNHLKLYCGGCDAIQLSQPPVNL